MITTTTSIPDEILDDSEFDRMAIAISDFCQAEIEMIGETHGTHGTQGTQEVYN